MSSSVSSADSASVRMLLKDFCSRFAAGHRGAILIVFCLLGPPLALWYFRSAEVTALAEIQQDAEMAAQVLNVSAIRALGPLPESRESPAYMDVKSRLEAFERALPDVQRIYLFRIPGDGEALSIFDSWEEDLIVPALPRERPSGFPEPLQRALSAGEFGIEGPYTDANGTWVSALVPVRDPSTGEVLAILGLDVDGREWRAGLIRHSVRPLLFLAGVLLFTAVVGTLASHQFSREASLRIQMLDRSEEIRFHAEFDRTMAALSEAFVHLQDGDFDATLLQALERLGELFAADRSYFFRFSDNQQTMKNTLEWCAPGIASVRDELQGLTRERFPWALNLLLGGTPVHIPRMQDLPPEASRDREMLEAQDIRSLLCLPLQRDGGGVLGFIGFDAVKRERTWAANEIAMLQIVSGMLGRAIDRMDTAANLQRANLLLREAQKVAALGAWELDVANQETFWTDEVFAIHEMEPGESPGFQQALSFIHADDRVAVETLMRRSTATLEPLDLTFRIVTARRSERWIRLFGRPLQDSDKGVRVVGMVQDITLQKQTEIALMHSNNALEEALLRANDLTDRAQSANIAKSQFLATMSHEIRTPLNAIIGCASLLMDSVLDEDQTELAETITTSGDALLALISDILDFSKIEAGRFELDRSAFSLVDLVESVTVILSGKARKRGLTLTSKIDPKAPEAVVGDVNRIRQILLNLLSNAIKFTEEGEVRFQVEKCPDDPGGTILCFTVADTGIGIRPETIKEIFEPFVQGDASITRRFGGTGLGLAISKRIADVLGASLIVTSEEGKGSAFRLTLHLPEADLESCSDLFGSADAVPVKGPTPSDGVKLGTKTAGVPVLRILIAEDNPVNAKVLGMMLKLLGHSVEVVDNGLLAFERACCEPFDLVLMDLQMPVMDGLTATRRLRAEPPPGNPRIPIVAVTANAMLGDREECLAAGMNAYLSKPVKKHELEAVLTRLFPA